MAPHAVGDNNQRQVVPLVEVVPGALLNKQAVFVAFAHAALRGGRADGKRERAGRLWLRDELRHRLRLGDLLQLIQDLFRCLLVD